MTKTNTPATLHAHQIDRAAHMMQDCMRLAAANRGQDALAEAMALNKSAMQRMEALQEKWTAQWRTWAGYAGALPEVNTLPKYLDRSNNILLQAQAQMMSQMTDLSELTENMTVSYSYWLAQQIEDLDKDAS